MKLPKIRWKWTLGALLGVLLLAQAVPYGRSHDNPPITGAPQWDSPATEALVRRACFDCHSNETVWPWYSNIAPASWLVQHDVDEGREHLNFSEFDRRQKHADDAAEEVESGEMPLKGYLLSHPGARLSESETRALVTGLRKTLGD